MSFYEPRFQIEVIRPLEGDVRVEVYSGYDEDTGRAMWARRESPKEVRDVTDEVLISESYFDLEEDIERLVLEMTNDEISQYEEKLESLLRDNEAEEVENPLYRVDFYHLDNPEKENVSQFEVGYDNIKDYMDAVEIFSEIQSLAHSEGRLVTAQDDEV